MIKPLPGVSCLFVLALALVLSGCQTSSPDAASARDVMQFEPTPRPEVGAEELAPVDGRSVTELLREADKAFQAANDAQQQGDQEAAVKHYTEMLQFLTAANLDPSIFYSVREEFGQILQESSKQYAYNPKQPHFFQPGDFTAARSAGALQIPFPLPERVLQEIDEIQRVYPKNFQRGLNRSYRYVPWIKEELRKAGLPEELAWLAMVESQYNEKIDSPVGAGGMWQFMKATGQHYNLRYDNYVDERYNWQSATRAAIAYLGELHDRFNGNWPLAIAAYNMGEYGLQRAVDANGGEQDFWKLIETPPASDRIKTETKKYFPRFLATCVIASNPERYGFTPVPESPVEVVRVPVSGVYALGDLDKALNLEAGTLAKLNPDLIAEITPPTGDHALAVLPTHRETLAAALPSLPQVSPNGPRRSLFRVAMGGAGGRGAKTASHKVQRGETISSIARKYKVASDDLVEANNLRGTRMLRVGQTLKIPAAGAAPAQQDEEVQVAASEAPEGKTAKPTHSERVAKNYTVRRGDTLSAIASRFKVSIKDLQIWNKLDKRSRIHTGSTLKIIAPGDAPTEMAAVAEAPVEKARGTELAERLHEVRAGEYPGKIAKEYGIDLNQLLEWNHLEKNSTIRVGDKLIIRSGDAAGVQAALDKSEAESTQFYEVRRGDSPSKIAAQYGVKLKDLLAWNGLDQNATLHIGDRIEIHGGDAPAAAPEPATDTNKELKLASTAPNAVGIPEHMHEVRAGEYPAKIASIYGVPLDSLLAWNNLSKTSTLRVGDKLVLRGGKADAPSPKRDAAPATPAQKVAPPAADADTVYVVQQGDFPAKIAKAHGVSVKDLMAWNHLGEGATIKIGDKLAVKGGAAPATKAEDASVGSPPPAKQAKVETPAATESAASQTTYKVAKGDSPYAIASKHKVKLADLLAWNNLDSKATLKIGQELVIRGGAAAPDSKPAQQAKAEEPAPAKRSGSQTTHKVAKGESPSSIASKYKVKLADLLAWNDLNSGSVLKIGQELVIQGSAGEVKVAKAAAPQSGKPVTHVVSAGHNPTVIARQYGVNIADLYKWNGWPEKHVLHIGDKVTVYKP